MLKNFLLCFITLCLFTLNAHPEATKLTEVYLENGTSFTITIQGDETKDTIELNPVRPTAWNLESSEDKSKLILNLSGMRIPSKEIPAVPVNADTVTTIKVRQKPGLRPVLQIIFTLVNARNEVRGRSRPIEQRKANRLAGSPGPSGYESKVERTREKVIVTFMKGRRPTSYIPIPETSPSRPQTETGLLPPLALTINGEVLDIIVFWNNGEFRRDTVPIKNGQISYRELGTVDVAGQQPDQIDSLLSERLKRYLVNYDIVIISKDRTQQAGKTVGIAGEVRSLSLAYQRTGPGEYTWSENLSLLNFISSAGGWTNKADLRNVKLIHRNGQVTQSGRAISMDVQKMKESGDYSSDIKLRPNDLVYIPARVEVDEQKVGVYGFVKKPGMKKLRKGLTIYQAIDKAGGPKYVKGMRVTLLRSNGDKIERDLQKIWVTKDRSADVKLRHGDVIYVRTK